VTFWVPVAVIVRSTFVMVCELTLGDVLQALTGAFFAVDSFFLLGGFLAAYLLVAQILKAQAKGQGHLHHGSERDTA
jgi:hypothetical protein